MGAATADGGSVTVRENLCLCARADGPIHNPLPYASHTRVGKVRAAMAEAILAAHRAGQVRAALARGTNRIWPQVLISEMG